MILALLVIVHWICFFLQLLSNDNYLLHASSYKYFPIVANYSDYAFTRKIVFCLFVAFFYKIIGVYENTGAETVQNNANHFINAQNV